jgi:hypothetical protein
MAELADSQQASTLDIVQGAIESAEPGAKAKGIRITAIPDPIRRRSRPMAAACSRSFEPAQQRDRPPTGRQDQVVLQRVNSSIELSVSDTGIGIAESHSHVRRFSEGLDDAQLRARPGRSGSWSSCTAARSTPAQGKRRTGRDLLRLRFSIVH